MTRVDPAVARRLGADVPARYSEAEEAFAAKVRMAGLDPPVREFAFHERRRWRFDFAYPRYRIAVEIEGGIYPMKQADGTMRLGRHSSGAAFEKDAEKYNEAAIRGWLVLRFTAKMVADGRALAMLEQAITAVGVRRGLPTRTMGQRHDLENE